MEAVLDLPLLFIATILFALVFDYMNGFHDAANAVATVVATKVLTPGQAVLMAAVFNFIGPLIAGVAVAKAIGSGIITTDAIHGGGINLVLAALIGANIWNLITWFLGIPISCSHGLIGGMVGAALAVSFSTGSIVWITHGPGGWLDHPKGVLIVIIFMVLAPLLGFLGTMLFSYLTQLLTHRMDATKANWWFRKLQLLSASFYAFTHGANDAQKVMGVITIILIAGVKAGHATAEQFGITDGKPPTWVILACATAIGLGTASGGWRIIRTMASRLTKLHPFEGFCAETGSGLVLMGTAHFGIPVSTTHVIAGGIMGVGATKTRKGVRWGVARRIFYAWVFTIPASALMAYLSYWLLSFIFPATETVTKGF